MGTITRAGTLKFHRVKTYEKKLIIKPDFFFTVLNFEILAMQNSQFFHRVVLYYSTFTGFFQRIFTGSHPIVIDVWSGASED